MSIRDIVDFSDFVIPEEAIELTSHAFRKAFQYDSYAGRKRFAAIVLNEPIPLQLEDIGLFTHVQEPSVIDDVKNFFGIAGAPRRISKFTFRARILGENSMHWFYPDPCDPAQQSDSAKLLKLIGLHTECTSTEDYQLQSGMKLPNRGDLVWIDLEYGDHGYDLQEGTFVSVMTPKDVEHNITAYASTQNCSPSLAAAFTGGGSGGGPVHARSRPAADLTPENLPGLSRPVVNRMDAVVGRNGGALTPVSIVMHYTAGHGGDGSIRVLGGRGLSYHYIIERDGTIKQLVRSNIRSIHGGVTNTTAIGIAFANLGYQENHAGRHGRPPIADWIAGPRQNGSPAKWEPYPPAQIAAGKELTRALKTKYPAITTVVGHSDFKSGKDDPGPAFPLGQFSAAVT